MATVLLNPDDAFKFFRKKLKLHPGGVFILGPAATGKSTIVQAMRQYGMKAYDGDKWGKQKSVNGEKQWHIDWSQVPKDFQIVVGVPDNIEELHDVIDVREMCVCYLSVSPERWRESMAARAKVETHYWVPLFKQYATWSLTKIAKYLRNQIQQLRARVPEYGDRTYSIRTADWPGYRTQEGRTKVKD